MGKSFPPEKTPGISYHFDKKNDVLWEVSTPSEFEEEKFSLKDLNPDFIKSMAFIAVTLLIALIILISPYLF